MKVKVKFNTVKGVLKDKKVVVVDDSIVRGTTSKALINLIREAAAARGASSYYRATDHASLQIRDGFSEQR